MAKQPSHRTIIIIGSIAAAVMFSFSFALVPLYSIICQATGISTSVPAEEWRQQNSAVAIAAAKQTSDKTRTVEVQFVAINNLGMPWKFQPNTKSVKVHPGETAKVSFFAKNMTDKPMTAQAIPSMTPSDAISHFHKIQCFCFNQQTLDGGATKDMGLVFNIDRDLPKDVHVITLAYTLFDVTPKNDKRDNS